MHKTIQTFQRFLLALLLAFIVTTGAFAQTTSFAYQGRLTDSGNPANGNYDLQFALFDNLSGGIQIGSTLSVSTADALSSACAACVQDSQISSVAGSKVNGVVANATNATNATNFSGSLS